MKMQRWMWLGALAALAGGCASSNGGLDDDQPPPDGPGTPEQDADPGPGPDAGPDALPTPPAPADPFTIDPSKQPMPFSQLATYFGPGEVTASVGGYQVSLRSRTACNEVTGCTAWITPGAVTLMESSGATRTPPASGAATLRLDTLASPPKITIEFAGSPVRFSCGAAPQTGTPAWDCSSYGSGLLWFADQYLGHPRLDNTTLIEWRGIIATDGTYQFVSRLASDLGTAVTGRNNLEQMAIHGAL